jgi:predicted pyridoxine 5'-phosphate oxidase superfamily flavin-nucleotide-binding protein
MWMFYTTPMTILTADMKRVIAEQKLGFVATVNADGTPNLSPKGTMQVLDDDHIIFADIRSPGTMANLARSPALEINFVDPFSRKGYRFRGTARIVDKGAPEFGKLVERYPGSMLSHLYKAFVVVKVSKAAPLVSPAYDAGATESALRKQYRDYFESIQPRR